MKVKKLLEQLSLLDDELDLVIYADQGQCLEEVSSIKACYWDGEDYYTEETIADEYGKDAISKLEELDQVVVIFGN